MQSRRDCRCLMWEKKGLARSTRQPLMVSEVRSGARPDAFRCRRRLGVLAQYWSTITRSAPIRFRFSSADTGARSMS